MTEGNPAARFRERMERLGEELELPHEDFAKVRVRVRDEILGLHNEIDELIAELTELKEGVRPIVERYKALQAKAESAPPVPRVIDHLGSSTYRERGWSALAGADYERAVKEMEKALGLDPDNHANLTLLGWALLRLEEYDRARPLLERVIDEDPEHPMARVCIGYLRMGERRFADAIESLSTVAREGSDRTARLYANLYLGMVYAEREMHRDAEAFFLRALELGPNLIEAYWELGRSRQREGRVDLALIAWKAGAANQYNPWGEKCQAAMEEFRLSK